MEKFIQVFKFFLGIIDAALDDVFASVCSNHKAYTNEKKKSLGKNDFTHIPHGHNGMYKTFALKSRKKIFLIKKWVHYPKEIPQ